MRKPRHAAQNNFHGIFLAAKKKATHKGKLMAILIAKSLGFSRMPFWMPISRPSKVW
jgi:hypothetical protein